VSHLQSGFYPLGDMISVARSEDHGQTWSSSVIPNSGAGDKTALALDHHPESPHHGNVYVAWCDTAHLQVGFARSVDGGRSFEPAIKIGAGGLGFTYAQLAVGRGGVVHLLWVESSVSPDPAPTGLLYARSDDGGASFSDPLIVAPQGMGSVAIAPSGTLLAVYSAADSPGVESDVRVPPRILGMQSTDGSSWSDAAPLSEPSPEVTQAFAVAASTDESWHVLSYDVEPASTTVRIYSAPHDDPEFRPVRDLAYRSFGTNDLWVGQSYEWRQASDVAFIGDYVGLAGAGSKLAAAIVLPGNDDWRSTPLCYAGIYDAEI
jgi:hypothetical protein